MEKNGKVEKKRGRPKTPLTVENEKGLTSNETEATKKGQRRKVTKRVSEDKQELTSNNVDDNVNDSSSSPDAKSPNESTSDNLPGKEANGTTRTSHNPTTSPSRSLPLASPMGNKSSQNREVILGTGDSFDDVEGYRVKKEVAPLLKAIFSKYGDIAKESTFSSMESRVLLLEGVCSIYKRLEASKFKLLTPLEIESMLNQIRDFELVKVDLGWLHRRFDQISKAHQMYKGVSTFEDVKARNLQDITEKQKEVQLLKDTYESLMALASTLQEQLQQAKDELSTAQSFADEINNIYD